MQPFLYLAILIVGFSINFAWDRTVRRRRAKELADTRREARPRALPVALDDDERARRLPEPRLRGFVELSRATFIELDALINHFDLLLLRARDRARFGVVTVDAERPRANAMQLLEGWIDGWRDVDEQTRERLHGFALGPGTVVGVLERERERVRYEFRRDTEQVLFETITDLDRAVIHMQGVVGLLEAGDDNPYR
ncbi:hypothetical protein DB30_07809 [Enhygromyxa salina]|uniref:Uncharacterized protein n=1 Tax=Enhygromyxa salina TaxID=215803 RepID=A0A0C1ZMX5_9BACT|nr:hypothetical protein [Enhygromyxa salina]KIG18794.1 hypothetical protein DB30_07809 [Enhygromyxa salina]